MKPPENVRTAVYRLFDANGGLVYVGISCQPRARIYQHREKVWYANVVSREIEWFPNRSSALAAEAAAIRAECPTANKARPNGSGGWSGVGRPKWTPPNAEIADRLDALVANHRRVLQLKAEVRELSAEIWDGVEEVRPNVSDPALCRAVGISRSMLNRVLGARSDNSSDVAAGAA